jgi:small subunit ribosomal protein S27e
MTSKRYIMIPKPQSNFISVQCPECGEKRIIFTHTTTDINCNSCGQALAKKAGAKANVLGKVHSILD